MSESRTSEADESNTSWWSKNGLKVFSEDIQDEGGHEYPPRNFNSSAKSGYVAPMEEGTYNFYFYIHNQVNFHKLTVKGYTLAYVPVHVSGVPWGETNGACGEDAYLCSAGDPINKKDVIETDPDTGVDTIIGWTWDCEGTGTGSTEPDCKATEGGESGIFKAPTITDIRMVPAVVNSMDDHCKLEWDVEDFQSDGKCVVYDSLDTPISPELTYPKEGAKDMNFLVTPKKDYYVTCTNSAGDHKSQTKRCTLNPNVIEQ